MAAILDVGYEAGRVPEEAPLTDRDELVRYRLQRVHADAKCWASDRERMLMRMLEGQPTFTLEILNQYVLAKADEINALRALQQCGWEPM